MDKCNKCRKPVIQEHLQCFLCSRLFHRQCVSLNKQLYTKVLQNSIHWYCDDCADIFPFQTLNDDDFFNETIECLGSENVNILQNRCYQFQDIYTEYNYCDFENQVDPDNNFFNDINNVCKYYTDDQFNENVNTSGSFNVIHLNARSIKANFENVKTFLDVLNCKFDVIAVSETWLCESDELEDYSIKNYNCVQMNRKGSRGGGVMIYIADHLQFNIVENMSFCIDGMAEIITVEINLHKCKNITVSCIYRKPGSDLEIFNENMSDIIHKLNLSKNYILCGDFNINLLKCNNHRGTNIFFDILSNAGLNPLVCLPTRVSSETATLIDNVFSNIKVDSNNGVLIDDTISDHLPIFACINYGLSKNLVKPSKYYFIRDTSDNNIAKFINELNNVNWDNVYNEKDVNRVYTEFISNVKHVYNFCCPIKKVKTKQHKAPKPWLTKGLLNCIRKKIIYTNSLLQIRTSIIIKGISLIKTG